MIVHTHSCVHTRKKDKKRHQNKKLSFPFRVSKQNHRRQSVNTTWAFVVVSESFTSYWNDCAIFVVFLFFFAIRFEKYEEYFIIVAGNYVGLFISALCTYYTCHINSSDFVYVQTYPHVFGDHVLMRMFVCMCVDFLNFIAVNPICINRPKKIAIFVKLFSYTNEQ